MHKYLSDIGIEVKEGCVPGMNNVSILTDSRAERFKKQIEEYGFDDRETWNLDYISACWLYEHLMMFREIGGQVVDLKFHKFNVKVAEVNREFNAEFLNEIRESDYKIGVCDVVEKELSQEQCIDTIIEYLKEYITFDLLDCSKEYPSAYLLKEMLSIEKAKLAFGIYADIFNCMWW